MMGGAVRLSVAAGRACALWLVLLGLLGCASSEQIRERQATAQAAQTDADDAQCKAAGAQPGTPAYDACRQKIVEKRLAEEAAQVKRREAFQTTTAEGTSSASGH